MTRRITNPTTLPQAGSTLRRLASALVVGGMALHGAAFAQSTEGPMKDPQGQQGGQQGGGYGPQGNTPQGGYTPQAGGYGPQGGSYGPQNGGNAPLLGAWSWQSPADTGGMISNTAVYGPDGSFALTFRLPTGLVARYWGTYRAQPAGPNQWQVESRFTGYLPQQVCFQAPGMPPNCQPAPPPPPGDSALVTFTGPDTVQVGNISAYRDRSPALAQMQVPAVVMQPVALPPGGAPGGGGGVAMGGGGAFNCSLGATRCTNGWVYRCEPVGTNTMWKTGAQRC